MIGVSGLSIGCHATGERTKMNSLNKRDISNKRRIKLKDVQMGDYDKVRITVSKMRVFSIVTEHLQGPTAE